jgi:hypothetical protein
MFGWQEYTRSSHILQFLMFLSIMWFHLINWRGKLIQYCFHIFLSQTDNTDMSIGDMNDNVKQFEKRKKSPEIVLKY